MHLAVGQNSHARKVLPSNLGNCGPHGLEEPGSAFALRR